jgi:hypothetical protein
MNYINIMISRNTIERFTTSYENLAVDLFVRFVFLSFR